jgi:acyl-coenzyme A thioesterase PaaI-like protein
MRLSRTLGGRRVEPRRFSDFARPKTSLAGWPCWPSLGSRRGPWVHDRSFADSGKPLMPARDPGSRAMRAFQDDYPDELAHCFGCGRLNEQGHQLRSFWDGDGSLARFTPKPFHMAVPGFVNGGVLASLIDCHATGTASAAVARGEGAVPNGRPPRRFVTASLHVEYLRPTPLGPELVVRGRIASSSGRKVVVEASIAAEGELTVRGTVVCVELPDSMKRQPLAPDQRS